MIGFDELFDFSDEEIKELRKQLNLPEEEEKEENS